MVTAAETDGKSFQQDSRPTVNTGEKGANSFQKESKPAEIITKKDPNSFQKEPRTSEAAEVIESKSYQKEAKIVEATEEIDDASSKLDPRPSDIAKIPETMENRVLSEKRTKNGAFCTKNSNTFITACLATFDKLSQKNDNQGCYRDDLSEVMTILVDDMNNAWKDFE
jgi:hypothetical protein